MAYSPGPVPTPGGRGEVEEAQVTRSPKGGPGEEETDLVVQSVTAAVERYLAHHRTAGATVPAGAQVSSPVLHEIVGGIVDRYFAKREPGQPACGCGTGPSSKSASGSAPHAAPANVEPPAPRVTIVDFVCEDDVRSAMAQGKKIFIGPRTIVTPSARELAAPGEILVRAER